MGVSKDHAELVSNGDTCDHVSDSATNTAQGGISFLLLEPHSKLNSFFASLFKLLFSDLKGTMSEGLSDLA